MPHDFATLLPQVLKNFPKTQTVFFFSVGPLEDHGPHLPLAFDVDLSQFLCREGARRVEQEMPGWVGVVMPALPLGLESNTSLLACTVRPHVLRDALVDICGGLARLGFCHFVCFSGHLGPKQLTVIEDAGKILRRKARWKRLRLGRSKGLPTLVSASSVLAERSEVFRSPLRLDPKEHGGRKDTSLGLYILKENGVPESYRDLPEVPRAQSRWMRNWKFRLHRTEGYWGKPSEASVKEGEAEVQNILDQVFPKLKLVWEGSNPQFLFKSWYSILPPNHSFFKAWVLFLVIVLTWLGWWYLYTSGLNLE